MVAILNTNLDQVVTLVTSSSDIIDMLLPLDSNSSPQDKVKVLPPDNINHTNLSSPWYLLVKL
jgi:hypothetical protein